MTTAPNDNAENSVATPTVATPASIRKATAIHCTVCSAALLPPTSTKEEKDESDPKFTEQRPLDFIALACAGSCQRCHAKQNNKNDGNNPNSSSGNYYYCIPDCFEHFLQHHWGIYSGLGEAHHGFPRGPLGGKACENCHSDLTVVKVRNSNDGDNNDDNNTRSSLTFEQALTQVSPKILAKALALWQASAEQKHETPSALTRTISSSEGSNTDEKDKDEDEEDDHEEEEEQLTIRRITQDLEEQRLLKCPSCRYKIAIPHDRGCDAAWCEHCSRALCLYCLTDCGDHVKTDATAHASSRLKGDAHEHVLQNDCGYTAGKGAVHSGKLLLQHHELKFMSQVALQLKRVPAAIRDAVIDNLQLDHTQVQQMMGSNNSSGRNDDDNNDDGTSSDKNHHHHHHHHPNLTELRRKLENDKWEQYPEPDRINFLHAAYKGDFPMVKCLLESGMPCNVPDRVGGETALHFAAVKGNFAVVQLLLEYGANPWQLSPPGRTPLDDLCNTQSSCDLETGRLLIRACMKMAPLHDIVHPWLRPWPNGTTAKAMAEQEHSNSPLLKYFVALEVHAYRLSKACADGDMPQVQTLLSNKSGKFPNDASQNEALQTLPPCEDLVWIYNPGSGCSPLLDLCAKPLVHSQQKLLEGVKAILQAAKHLDESCSTPSSTKTKSIKQLLHMRDYKFHATILHWLALDTRPAILQVAGLVLQHGGGALAKSVDKRGHTPLDWARKFSVVMEDDAERAKHVERWQVLILAWEEDS